MQSKPSAPSLSAQVDALAIAFVELSKFLGRNDGFYITQLAAAIENEAKASKSSAEVQAAASELARRLR